MSKQGTGVYVEGGLGPVSSRVCDSKDWLFLMRCWDTSVCVCGAKSGDIHPCLC